MKSSPPQAQCTRQLRRSQCQHECLAANSNECAAIGGKKRHLGGSRQSSRASTVSHFKFPALQPFGLRRPRPAGQSIASQAARSKKTKTTIFSCPLALRALESKQMQWHLKASTVLPRAGPNPSVKRSANGRPPGPGLRYAVHFLSPGPGVLPLSPAYLER